MNAPLSIKHTFILLFILLILFILTIPKKVSLTYIIKDIPRKVGNLFSNKVKDKDKINVKEKYDDRYWLGTHTNFPFWNVQLGNTRNMSYDLRGDIPIRPYGGAISPWLNPGSIPIVNKPLWMVS